MSLHASGDRLIARLERKMGHIAIPNLLRWVGIFQVLVYALILLYPGYWETIAFDPARILKGEVWRLFSYVFFPRAMNPVFLLISVIFLWFISDGLERAWGSFRVNLYVVVTIIFLSSAGMILGPASSLFLGLVFFESVLFAFATLYPNVEIMLMLIIPIKIKYVGLIGAAVLAVAVFQEPVMVLAVIPGLIPYFCVFLPPALKGLENRGKVKARRQRFDAGARPESEAFHTCSDCGKTDVQHPHLEFRVTDEGEELCVDCLEARRGRSTTADV